MRGGVVRAAAGVLRAAAAQEPPPGHQARQIPNLSQIQHHQLEALETEARHRHEAIQGTGAELHDYVQRLNLLQEARSRLTRPPASFRSVVPPEELLLCSSDELSELLEQWEKGMEDHNAAMPTTPSEQSAEQARQLQEVKDRWGYMEEEAKVVQQEQFAAAIPTLVENLMAARNAEMASRRASQSEATPPAAVEPVAVNNSNEVRGL